MVVHELRCRVDVLVAASETGGVRLVVTPVVVSETGRRGLTLVLLAARIDQLDR